MPKMGRRPIRREVTRPSVANALFSRTQQRVLALFFGQPGRGYRMTELIALTGSGSGAVQREVKRLVDSGLVTRTSTGRDKAYRANQDAAIFRELHGIVEKTIGVATVIHEALAAVSNRIRFGILYGSVAKQSDTMASDIDVLCVSDDLTLEEVYAALAPAERRLGRRVSPTLYTSGEFRRARRDRDAFLTKVLAGKHIVLIGTEDAIAPTG